MMPLKDKSGDLIVASHLVGVPFVPNFMPIHLIVVKIFHTELVVLEEKVSLKSLEYML